MVARFRHTMFRSAWRGSLLMVQTELIHTHTHTHITIQSAGMGLLGPAKCQHSSFHETATMRSVNGTLFIHRGASRRRKKTSHTHTHTHTHTHGETHSGAKQTAHCLHRLYEMGRWANVYILYVRVSAHTKHSLQEWVIFLYVNNGKPTS